MKKLLPLFTLFLGLTFVLASCSDNDDPGPQNGNVPESILNQFNEQFPDAQNVIWETKASGYYTASFTTADNPQNQSTAWFSNQGQWDMTHYEIPFSALPQAVKDAFNESAYGQSGSGWRLDDDEVDVLDRNGNEKLYIIEVKKNENGIETEVDLYFTENGILTKEIADTEKDDDYYEDYLPQQPQGSIQEWLAASKYKDAKIIEIDSEDDGTEVELIYEGKKVEILFDRSQQWIYSKTEFGRRNQDQVPAIILDAVKQSAYWQDGATHIDDIDFYETQQAGNYYCIELEGRYDDDIKVYVDENGNLMEQRPNPGGDDSGQGGVPVEGDIQTFIEEKYPGARILEKEYDDGLLEVEIWHENREKTVKFNGRNEWIRSEWEVRISELPQAVSDILAANGYTPDDDDAEYAETPDSQWYEVEVKKNGEELKLYISPEGDILSSEYDD